MSVDPRIRGVDHSQEVSSRIRRPDTRNPGKRWADWSSTSEGIMMTMGGTAVATLLLIYIPFAFEFILFWTFIFYFAFARVPKDKKWDFPYRVPAHAGLYDGSIPGREKGKGITYLGHEISTKLQIWAGKTDLGTHQIVSGTTGSGKTEALLGIVYNALVQNSGFTYIDGKGDPKLAENVFRLLRYVGREDDLLMISFLTSGRDFLDAQDDRVTNTCAPFAMGSSGMVTELQISLMDDGGGGNDMWKGRSIAWLTATNRPLIWMRDKGMLLLEPSTYISYFELPVAEKMVFQKKVTINGEDIDLSGEESFARCLAPLEAFILGLPGYKTGLEPGEQEQKTSEQWGYCTMQVQRLFNDLTFTYAHLFSTSQGEVDIPDVAMQRRVMTILLPALERSPDSLKMLGKVIVGQIKQMMAGCLGNRVEGVTREIIDSRPTNSPAPYYITLDEYGYYVVVGFAPQPLNSIVHAVLDDGHIVSRQLADLNPGDRILSGDPDTGAITPSTVKEITGFQELPVYRLRTTEGKEIEAAGPHIWECRINGTKRHASTDELRAIEGIALANVQVPVCNDNKTITWEHIEAIIPIGHMPCACLTIDAPSHLYLSDSGILTHNCAPAQARSLGFTVIFGFQDFAAIKKGSPEEAESTWENTNIRWAGRMTGGTDSETFRKLNSVTGKATIEVITGRDHRYTDNSQEYRLTKDTRFEDHDRLNFDDLAGQENGEFHIIVGKKSTKGQGVRVIRAMSLYTAGKRPAAMRLNHFVRCEPPTPSEVLADAITNNLEQALFKAFSQGNLAKVYPNNVSRIITSATSTEDKLLRVGLLIDHFDAGQIAPNHGILAAQRTAAAMGMLNDIQNQQRAARAAEAAAKAREQAEATKRATSPAPQPQATATPTNTPATTAAKSSTATAKPPAATAQPAQKKAIPTRIGKSTLSSTISGILAGYLDEAIPLPPLQTQSSSTVSSTKPVKFTLLTGAITAADGDVLTADDLDMSAEAFDQHESNVKLRNLEVRKANEAILTLIGSDPDIVTIKAQAEQITSDLCAASSYIEGSVPSPTDTHRFDHLLNELDNLLSTRYENTSP